MPLPCFLLLGTLLAAGSSIPSPDFHVADASLVGYAATERSIQIRLRLRNNAPKPIYFTAWPERRKLPNFVAIGHAYYAPPADEPGLGLKTTIDPPDRDGVLPRYSWQGISYYRPYLATAETIETVLEIPTVETSGPRLGVELLIVSKFRDAWTSHLYRIALRNSYRRNPLNSCLRVLLLAFLAALPASLLYALYRVLRGKG